jgi:DNA mismatch repair protein MutL
LVLSSIREKLLGSDLTPLAQPQPAENQEEARQEMQARLAAFFRGEVPTPLSGADTSTSSVQWRAGVREDTSPTRTLAISGFSPDAPLAPRGERDLSAPQSRVPVGPTSAIQLHNSYLVAESEDGLVIIDQHALHERIMFEDLMARVTRGPLESQRLLIPQVLPATARQMAMLEQIQPLLARLGIEVSAFGPESVAVQAFPSFLQKLEPGEFVRELLERGEQELLDLHEEALLHGILDMMACKAAVKAGDPLTAGEIDALLARRELVERSSNCPHGRPTTLRLSLKDLEKQFKRTGF